MKIDKRVLAATERAIDALGDYDSAMQWLHTPSNSLNGFTPYQAVMWGKECLVHDALTRIEIGVEPAR